MTNKELKKIISSDKYNLLIDDENKLFYALKKLYYKLQIIFKSWTNIIYNYKYQLNYKNKGIFFYGWNKRYHLNYIYEVNYICGLDFGL